MFVTNNLSQVIQEVLQVCDKVLISGPPGIGKSEIVYQVCDKLNLKVYETRLYEQGESAAGLPRSQDGITRFDKPFWLDELIKGGYQVLFLDDFHLVPPQIQKFLYKLLTHKELHDYKVPQDLKIILAGNFKIDSADSSEVQSPIMSRLHLAIEYEPDQEVFLKFARSQPSRFDSRIIAFIQANPDLLYTKEPPSSEMFPCPRTWEYASRVVSKFNSPSLVPGIVGTRAGSVFQEFWSLLNQDYDTIIKTVSHKSSIKDQVIASLISAQEYCKERDVSKRSSIFKYVEQFKDEIKFLFARRCFEVKEMEFIQELKAKSPSIFKTIVDLGKEIAR